ncbi:MAG TPA: methylated-DNA--[protein]-cysteine S-methyltransferase [Actinomycetales bacterium]|nr:methylated-DNA--[protein]-cysteine S-methyltransferase [Actinomycetales bacterium]
MTTSSLVVDSPVGPLVLADTEGRLSGLRLPHVAEDGTRSAAPLQQWQPVRRPTRLLQQAVDELAAYFAGELTQFELPLQLGGTPFQLRVWQALREIPFGATATYGELAEQLGSSGASRAVGLASNRNPVPIIVPCHRVIGAGGGLVGFGGGLACKRWLLDHESAGDQLFTL